MPSDIVTKIIKTLNDELFSQRVITSKSRWLDFDYQLVKDTITNFLLNL